MWISLLIRIDWRCYEELKLFLSTLWNVNSVIQSAEPSQLHFRIQSIAITQLSMILRKKLNTVNLDVPDMKMNFSKFQPANSSKNKLKLPKTNLKFGHKKWKTESLLILTPFIFQVTEYDMNI